MSKIARGKITEVVYKIVKEYQPEKVILFGSYVWGKPNKDSDIDLLIIKKTKEDFLKRSFAVREIIDGLLPVDILVRTPKEINKRLNLGDFFYRNIITKGKSLYEKAEK